MDKRTNPVVAHPQELAALDLFDVWRDAQPLVDQFDPFQFSHRMAAYRLLIDTTNHDELFGADNRRNPLWGLMFQHQWQFRTGRLGADSTETGRIEPDAPWGYGNYTLNVVLWLGAVAAGVVPSLNLVAPSTDSRFEYASGGGPESLRLPAEFEAGVADWREFFELVQKTPAGGDPEPLRMAMWKAHKTCLDVVAERIFVIDPAPYSTVELTFLQGWCRMVDYLWAAAWPTDFDFMSEHGLDVLPERLLAADEVLRGQSDLPKEVRSNVTNVIGLGKMPKWRYNVNLSVWRRIMRTRSARTDVLALLDAVFNPNPGNRNERLRLVGYLLRP